jgi:hypothetical protein
MKQIIVRATGLSLLSGAVFLSGCQQARVDRWVFVPCQPHEFYIAPKGQTLEEVAATCQVDKSLLYKHNAWLITHQPFEDNTVVWLKHNPSIAEEDEDLQVNAIDAGAPSALQEEQLTPLNLPTRIIPHKHHAPLSSAQ